MSTVCAASGCANAAARADCYCYGHRTRLRRYGHPLQQPVTARDLAPFACRIASRLPDDGELRAILAERWSALVTMVEAVRRSGTLPAPDGSPSSDRRASVQEWEAARRFLITAQTATAKAAADLVIGLAMLRAVEPGAFEDRDAFRFILARRFFGLSPVNAARARRSGSTTWRTYPPVVTLTVAGWLWSAFGEVAEAMAAHEAAEIAKAKADRGRLRAALACLETTAA